MPSDNNTATTETTDSNPRGEQEEAPASEKPPEPPAEKYPGEGGSADTASADGFGAGAAAVVSAGLGLSSLTGTSIGDMLRYREEIVGQIESATGGGGDQVEALYGAPWHMAALVNGSFALVAVLIGGMLLATRARSADTRAWVKAVALGGVVLGAIGLVVAGGMYFDLFAGQPEMPASRGMGG